MKLAFCCVVPPDGGETPIGDSRAILEASRPASSTSSGARRQYVRTLHGGRGAGSSWQDTFQSQDRSGGGGAPRLFEFRMDRRRPAIASIRPAIATHPVTGEDL